MSVGTGSLEETKWRTLKCRMVEGRRKPGVVRHLGRIYVVGGMTSKRKDIATVDVFNPITEEWEKDNTPPLMTELCGTRILYVYNMQSILGYMRSR